MNEKIKTEVKLELDKTETVTGNRIEKLDKLATVFEKIKNKPDSDYFVLIVSDVGAFVGGEYTVPVCVFAKAQMDIYFKSFIDHIKKLHKNVTQEKIDEMLKLAKEEIHKAEGDSK